MSVRTYNPSVRVGNWNEDLCLEEVSQYGPSNASMRLQCYVQLYTQLSNAIVVQEKYIIYFANVIDVVCISQAFILTFGPR